MTIADINSGLRINKLEELWESACGLMVSHFKQDLQEQNLEVGIVLLR